MSGDPLQEALESGDMSHAVHLLRAEVDAAKNGREAAIWYAGMCDARTRRSEQTIAMLREHLAESRPTAMGSLDADAILEYDSQRTHPCSSETASIIRAIADKPHFAPVEIEGVIMERARCAEANANLRRENRALRAAIRGLETMLDIVKGSK